MGKSSSEQHFHKSNTITFIMGNFWSPTPSATGAYGRLAGWLAGWQADEIQVNFEIFKKAEILKFSLRLTKIQHHNSLANAFQWVFSSKTYAKQKHLGCKKIARPRRSSIVNKSATKSSDIR